MLALIHVAVYAAAGSGAHAVTRSQAGACFLWGSYVKFSPVLVTMIGVIALAVTLVAWSHALDKAKRAT